MGKPITEMSNEELEAEIMRLQQTRPPSAPTPRRAKRLDETKPRKRSLMDLLKED